MSDPKQKLIEQQEKRIKMLAALRAEQERIEKERLENAIKQTGQPTPNPSQPPNK